MIIVGALILDVRFQAKCDLSNGAAGTDARQWQDHTTTRSYGEDFTIVDHKQ